MRVLLVGSSWLGAAVLDALRVRGHDIVGAWDQTGGRLATAARDQGIALVGAAGGGQLGAELLVSAHCTWLIPAELLWSMPAGGIGYHPSLLPLHRGGDAVRWAIHMRERVTGGTVFWLDARADGGPILSQDWCFIRPGDDAGTLWRRDLAPLGVRLLAEAVDLVAAGKAPSVPQDEALATWEPTFRRARLGVAR